MMTPDLLPRLREDLLLLEGPPLTDGSPTWTLQDPVRNLFFRLGRREFEMLARWGLGAAAALADAIDRETTLGITPADIESLASFLSVNLLLSPANPGSREVLRARAGREKTGVLKWLLSHYLFIRIPLFHPDRFLDATLPGARLLMTRGFGYLLMLTGLAGIFLAGRQWEAFTHSLLQFFTFQGVVFYGLAVCLAKTVHELGHAYTAKRYGVRVPTMGIAFLVLFPMLYSDTSESWKVKDPRARMAIVAAGVLWELALAVLAIFLWNFLPDGPARSACFVIGTVTWATSLLLNLSPFMRFDGYYLLSDFLGVPNLHDRSFALGRWAMGKSLLGLDLPCPENMSPGQRRFLILFAFATWVYRLLIFTGIALLVYHLFFKALGLVLFCVEITWFIVLPLFRQARVLLRNRSLFRWNARSLVSVFVCLGAAAFVFLPRTQTITIPALLKSGAMTSLYPPFSAQIKEIRVRPGQQVAKGELLFVLNSPELEFRERIAKREVRILEAQLRRQTNQYDLMEQIHIIERRLSTALTRLQGYQARKAQLRITSPKAGWIQDLADNLHPGRWVNAAFRLASHVDAAGVFLEGYVGEGDLDGLKPGLEARFYPEARAVAPLDCRIREIDAASTRTLEEPDLTSLYRGQIPVSPPAGGEGQWKVRTSVYRVILVPVREIKQPDHTLRGEIRIQGGKAQSLMSVFRTRIQAVFIRESGV